MIDTFKKWMIPEKNSELLSISDIETKDLPILWLLGKTGAGKSSLLKAETIYPLAILDDQPFGIEALEEAIQAQYNEAIQTQLNRRNIEAKDRQSGFINQGVRLFNGVSGVVQAVMKTEK